MNKIELEEDELDFHHNTKIEEIYSPNVTQLINVFNRVINELSIETSIFSIADILMSECLWQKVKEKELNDYIECVKGLERYKDRKQLFNPNTRRVYKRGALENYEKEIIELEKGSSRVRKELHIALTIVTKYLERTDLRLAGKNLKLGQSASIPLKYNCVYERMSLAKCKCEWRGVLRGNDFGAKGCKLCENEESYPQPHLSFDPYYNNYYYDDTTK